MEELFRFLLLCAALIACGGSLPTVDTGKDSIDQTESRCNTACNHLKSLGCFTDIEECLDRCSEDVADCWTVTESCSDWKKCK